MVIKGSQLSKKIVHHREKILSQKIKLIKLITFSRNDQVKKLDKTQVICNDLCTVCNVFLYKSILWFSIDTNSKSKNSVLILTIQS